MRFRILVIDDELSKPVSPQEQARKPLYDEFSKRFDLHFVEQSDQLAARIEAKDYDLVLLDFILEGWNTDVRIVLKMIDSRIPVALISKHWGPHFDKLRHILDDFRQQIAQLFTWDDLADARRLGVMQMWLDVLIRRSKDLAVTSIEPNDTIRIMQLSDLQFGSSLPDGFAVEAESIAETFRTTFGKAPEFIAVTGDIAERGLPSEYECATRWITGLAKQLNPSGYDGRYLVVPGNHDLCRPLGWSSRFVEKEFALGPKLQFPELQDYSLMPFRQFAAKLDTFSRWEEGRDYWINGRFRHLGTIFFGCNTSQELDVECRPTRAIASQTVAEMFRDLAQLEEDAPDALSIGLIHHPLMCSKASEQIANPDTFRQARSNRPAIVLLTGHWHGDGYTFTGRNESVFLQLEAGTTTKGESDRPPNSVRGFNIIELIRSESRVTSVKVNFCRFDNWNLKIARSAVFSRSRIGGLSEIQKRKPSTRKTK
jgi:hypothetical protein